MSNNVAKSVKHPNLDTTVKTVSKSYTNIISSTSFVTRILRKVTQVRI